MSDEPVLPCVVCGKVWVRNDVDKWVFHESRGVVCRHHHGVMDWYNELVEKANKELEALDKATMPDA